MDDSYIPEESWRYAAEAENALIGCILVAPEITIEKIRGIVAIEDFQTEAGKAVFIAASDLIDEGAPCDPVLIQERASKRGLILDSRFCAEAMSLYKTTANVAENARIIHEAAIQNAFHALGAAIRQGDVTISEAQEKLRTIQEKQCWEISDPFHDANTFMDHIVAVSDGKVKPFRSSGFASLDKQLSGGLVTSGLITMAARPGTGKTTVALNIADNVAAAGGTVLYFSLEMDKDQLWARRVARLKGLNYAAVYDGSIAQNEAHWQRFVEGTAELSGQRFYIWSKPATIEDIEKVSHTIKGLSLVVVDHIGQIKTTQGARNRSRYELITDISHRLKQLALSLQIPVLALCQLNRESEKRTTKRPTMAELRDSGAIEEDSDVVCLLFREAVYLPDKNKPKQWESQTIEVIVDKNRHGMTGTVFLDFYGATAKISERGGLCA